MKYSVEAKPDPQSLHIRLARCSLWLYKLIHPGEFTVTVQNQELSLTLNNGWEISRQGGSEQFTVDFPTDIHSSLLGSHLIEDPYWRDRETSLDWVHQSEWVAKRHFTIGGTISGRYFLSLSGVDCQAVVSVNNQEVARLGNRFRRYDIDVSSVIAGGENQLSIVFLSNSAIAKELSDDSPFPVPYISWNNRIPHFNFLRKPQCDAGWDWNIALSPLGLYGQITLNRCDPIRLESFTVRQQHANGNVCIDVELHTDVSEPVEVEANVKLGRALSKKIVRLFPGENTTTLSVSIEKPRLWWPVGYGAQDMYDLEVGIGHLRTTCRIGLREINLITETDEIGSRFVFCVNGQEIFMRGANWIPADALPARATPEVVADLLDSALDANMNMLRIWGGGTYEQDWFYEMCSERGLLIWQDFMFACNLYPASDRKWLDDVRLEAQQQVRRLSRHPCVALWCGDNELVGAINWFDESRKDRDRYLANYDRLNHALEEVVQNEAVDIPWWPSSPSAGRLNFGDGWHDDTSGDMHFWDVWHSAKDFEHYRTVKPRFCSEFGFQSFPSPRLIETFTLADDRNVSSPIMDVHQRNEGGNGRIVETLARYFRFPDGFDEMCWLSQVAQSVAMKTAIEFWRSAKPRCMGTLYWQLNDTWPVASWSTLEYGGNWKLAHYAAKRFYTPVLVTAQPDTDSNQIILFAINDTRNTVSLTVNARAVDFDGPVSRVGNWVSECPTDRAVEIARIPVDSFSQNEFLYFDWQDTTGRHTGNNEYLLKRPKYYDMPTAHVSVEESGNGIKLETDKPALYVTYGFGDATVWSDNCITLLPGTPQFLTVKSDQMNSQNDNQLLWLNS